MILHLFHVSTMTTSQTCLQLSPTPDSTRKVPNAAGLGAIASVTPQQLLGRPREPQQPDSKIQRAALDDDSSSATNQYSGEFSTFSTSNFGCVAFYHTLSTYNCDICIDSALTGEREIHARTVAGHRETYARLSWVN